MRGRKQKPREIEKLIKKDIFTTFDVSNICQVNIASIKNWIMKGYLKAFRTPGGHFRVQKRHLINFLNKYNMPNPFTGGVSTVYYLGEDGETFRKKLEDDFNFEAFSKEKHLYAGIGKTLPNVILVDTTTFKDYKEFVKDFRENPEFESIKLVALSDSDEPIEGFDATIKKNSKKLVELIDEV